MNTDYEIAQAVIEAIEKAYGIHDLTEHTRRRRVAKARQLAYIIIRDLTDLSLYEIAEVTGRKDHTTVMHGCQSIEKDKKYMQFVPRILADVERLLGREPEQEGLF